MNEFQNALLIAAPYFFYLLGGIARIVIPFVVSKAQQQQSVPFNWKLIRGLIVAWLAGLIPLALTTPILDQIGAMGYLVALGAGWGAGDIGREGQKVAGLRG